MGKIDCLSKATIPLPYSDLKSKLTINNIVLNK